jgi:hypothetical protein
MMSSERKGRLPFYTHEYISIFRRDHREQIQTRQCLQVLTAPTTERFNREKTDATRVHVTIVSLSHSWTYTMFRAGPLCSSTEINTASLA